MHEEKELVELAQKGDETAFCTLYELYAKKLYNYAMFRLSDPYDAEDAVQSCMLTAFEQIGKLKKAEAFSAWIFKILYHSCVALIKEQAQKRETDDIDDYLHLSSGESEKLIRRSEVHDALAVLTQDEQSIVLLSVIGGLKSKEIAKITGYSPGNVRQKLSRSLAKMKKRLE